MNWPALPALLRVHPNAAVAPLGRGRWYPLFHLVWLFWMVAAPWYVEGGSRSRIIVLTLVSLAIFLPLYFRAWYGDSRRCVWNTAAIAALGLVMIPVNTSWSYLIYASVLIPYCTTPKRSMAWLGALMIAFTAVATWTGFPALITIAAIAMCVVLSLIT